MYVLVFSEFEFLFPSAVSTSELLVIKATTSAFQPYLVEIKRIFSFTSLHHALCFRTMLIIHNFKQPRSRNFYIKDKLNTERLIVENVKFELLTDQFYADIAKLKDR